MTKEPNHQLASLMREARSSNKGLARRICEVAAQHGEQRGTTHVSVQRWLDGGGIQPQTAVFVAEALGEKLQRRVTPTELGFSTGTPAASATPKASYAESLPEALSVLDDLARKRPEDTPTGELLLSEPDFDHAALTWLVSRPDGLSSDSTASRRVGIRDIAAIRTAAGYFMRLDFQFGGGHAHKAFRHYFREEVLPLLGGSYSTKAGKALFEAATEISQLLAWTAYDSGNHALAGRYLMSTLRLTQVIDDRMMGARILANMSHQANYLGQASRAARLARAAVEGGRTHSTPRGMALFAAHEARALSTAQDRKGAARAMNEAERFFDLADTGNDPEWLSYMDEAELVGEFCHCFRDLGQGREAVQFAERAVALTDPKYARTLGFCRVVLAQSQLLNGELEAAITTASLALDDGDALQSARFQRYITDFQRTVSTHTGNPAVQQFNEQVREAMAYMDDS
ncbi:sporulation protein [Streptomyces cucumeris]|uniref:sporulation protein n=1 Tax=Streptomyces cucumeris TaxID=2962890 RepID=UPI003EBD3226